MTRVDEEMKTEIVQLAAQFEHRIKIGSKPIFHLEGAQSVKRSS